MSTLPSRVPSEAARREHFIPLRKTDLGATLARYGELAPAEAQEFDRFCRLLHVVVHADLQPELEELKAAYAPFDPDADTRAVSEADEIRLGELRGQLFARFARMLARGNFIRLSQARIDAALADRSHWGLHLLVDFSMFERLELYYRGDILGTRYRRRLTKGFRPEAVEVPIYQRLAVIFRLRPGGRSARVLDTRAVHIKLFKDIPQPDLEMLLPETRVKMTLVDRLRVTLPTLSGIGIAVYKIFWVASVALGMSLAFLLLIGGTVGYGVRSLYGYLNTRQKYQLNLTQSLYYQNIDNNAGVIHRLVDEAEEQENREVMLAWFFLWRKAPPAGWTAAELDSAVEAFLHAEAEQAIDFEISDALAKLARFGLAAERDGKWTGEPLDAAIAALARHWSALPERIG